MLDVTFIVITVLFFVAALSRSGSAVMREASAHESTLQPSRRLWLGRQGALLYPTMQGNSLTRCRTRNKSWRKRVQSNVARSQPPMASLSCTLSFLSQGSQNAHTLVVHVLKLNNLLLTTKKI